MKYIHFSVRLSNDAVYQVFFTILSLTAIGCPPLPMFPNGMITYSSGPLLTFPVGTEAVYQCNAPEGYCLPAGATLRECQPSGTWSGAAPEPCGSKKQAIYDKGFAYNY